MHTLICYVRFRGFSDCCCFALTHVALSDVGRLDNINGMPYDIIALRCASRTTSSGSRTCLVTFCWSVKKSISGLVLGLSSCGDFLHCVVLQHKCVFGLMMRYSTSSCPLRVHVTVDMTCSPNLRQACLHVLLQCNATQSGLTQCCHASAMLPHTIRYSALRSSS